MSVSSVDICNDALAQLKEARITELTDTSNSGLLCNQYFQQCLEEILRMFDWNFASAKVQLSQLTETPLFGWEFAYSLPVNYLMIRSTNLAKGTPWTIQEDQFLSNVDSAEIKIRYTKLITNYNLMDPMFGRALAYYLAFTIAYPLTGKHNIRNEMFKFYQYFMDKAKDIDGIEETPDNDPVQWVNVGRGTL